METKRVETCARCGHQSGGCPQCDRVDPFLGASIDGDPYCHTFSEATPTCYMQACWDQTWPARIGDEFLVRPTY